MSSLPPLPQAQAELTTLLVDVPHLAGLAERAGALEHVNDPRLAPVLHAVIEGAKEGRQVTMPELLDTVEPAAQSQLHRHVFTGKYRADGDDTSAVDPQLELQVLLHRCRIDALDARVRQLDVESHAARAEGDLDRFRELQRQRYEVRREQATLRQSAPALPS